VAMNVKGTFNDVEQLYTENETDENAQQYVEALLKLLSEQEKDEIQETVDKIKKIYKKHPTNETAQAYAISISNLTCEQERDEIRATANEMKEIYENHSASETALAYAMALCNLLAKQEEPGIRVTANEIKDIYEKHSTNRIALQYVQALVTLLKKQEEQEKRQEIVTIIKGIYDEHETEDVAVQYSKAWASLIIKQEKKEEKEETIKKIEEIYGRHKKRDIARRYAKALASLTGTQEELEERQKTVTKIGEIYQDYQTSEGVAFRYVIALVNLTKKQEGQEERQETVTKIGEIYNTHKTSRIALRYLKVFFDIYLKQNKEQKGQIEEIIRKIFNKEQGITVFQSYMESEGYPKLNKVFENFKIAVKEPIEMQLNTIFEKIKGNQYRGEIKVQLMSLYINVIELKKKARFNPKKTTEICHYTKLENIKHVLGTTSEGAEKSGLKKGKEAKLRLFNSEYMNDPSEGKTFLDLLKKQDEDEKLMVMLGNYYSNGWKEERGRDTINKSNIYLVSFSKKPDYLPMWSQYGDDGKGCCLVVEANFFDEEEMNDYDVEALHNSTITEEEIEEENDKSGEYVLYDVTYARNEIIGEEDEKEQSQDEKEQAKLIQKIAKSLIKLNDSFEKILDKSIKSVIDEFITGTLDQVRFLFKDKSYEHERELRLIKFSEKSFQENNEKLIVPKLYIEIEKSLKYKEIILGPKVAQPSTIAPYIYSTKKVEKVTRSSIKYR